MAVFVTPSGSRVEARGPMADLFRRRGWTEERDGWPVLPVESEWPTPDVPTGDEPGEG